MKLASLKPAHTTLQQYNFWLGKLSALADAARKGNGLIQARAACLDEWLAIPYQPIAAALNKKLDEHERELRSLGVTDFPPRSAI